MGEMKSPFEFLPFEEDSPVAGEGGGAPTPSPPVYFARCPRCGAKQDASIKATEWGCIFCAD
jgi:hypothetical protein